MPPEINKTKEILAPLKQVTPLSKYLALALFVTLPFIGGYIGYTFAPEKVVEVYTSVPVLKDSDEESVLVESITLCGIDFKINSVYIDGINLADKIDMFLRADKQTSFEQYPGSSCEEFIDNVRGSTVLKMSVHDYSVLEPGDGFDAYLIKFFPNKLEYEIDVAFFINKKTFEVFRVLVLDGGKGPKVGVLNESILFDSGKSGIAITLPNTLRITSVETNEASHGVKKIIDATDREILSLSYAEDLISYSMSAPIETRFTLKEALSYSLIDIKETEVGGLQAYSGKSVNNITGYISNEVWVSVGGEIYVFHYVSEDQEEVLQIFENLSWFTK